MADTENINAEPLMSNFRAFFAAIPTPYLVMTPDLVIADANEAYLLNVGRTRQELIGVQVFDAFPPTPDALDETGVSRIQLSFERAIRTRQADTMPVQKYDIPDPDSGGMAERFWSLISVPILDAEGEVVLVVQRAENITDFVRERDQARAVQESDEQWRRRVEAVEADLYGRGQELAAALAAKDVAARLLASVGQVALELVATETLEDLERVIVDRGLTVLGADGGAILTPDGNGDWRLILPSLGAVAEATYSYLPYDSPLPASWAARNGKSLLLPNEAAGLAFDPAMKQVYEDTKRYGWAFLPLTARGECLGSLAVAWADEHTCTADEFDLLVGFAAQCAQALVRIYAIQAEREATAIAQKMSETLQRSLLTKPPTPDSLQIAVRYQPAVEQVQVGGDWYDAFVTASNQTLIVVGDVSGHDRAAAATMSQVRNLLRGIAYDSETGSAELLTRLDLALRGLELDSLATALLGRIEQGGETDPPGLRRLYWSNAGHLPPLLRMPDGTVRILNSEPNLLLGLDPSVERTEQMVDLLPGSTLLLFTDGLVERRGADLDYGIADLAAVLAAEGVVGPEELCDRMLKTVGGQGNYDDIALLVLHVNDETASNTTERTTLAADPRSVRQARTFVANVCARAGVINEVRDAAVLLVSEVVTNAVVHAGSDVRLSVTIDGSDILVEVGDSDSSPPLRQTHDISSVDGRGVELVALVSKAWGVRLDAAGKVVWFRLDAA